MTTAKTVMHLFGRPAIPPPRRRQLGQSVVEFALILPVLILVAVAVGDFGRIYASMIALESATREAADYGAFDEAYWDTTSEARDGALAEMWRRACTAASSMPGYAGAPDNSTCTNPVFEFDWDTEATADYGQGPIRVILARGTFTFATAVSFPPLPASVTIVRESRFAVWKVDPLESEGSPDPSIEAPPSIPVPSESPLPSETPSESPSAAPSTEPTSAPTPEPTPVPSEEPSVEP